MNYILEAIFVGIYCSLLGALLSLVKMNMVIFLFTVGFTKHAWGYYLKIQQAYCNYGDACTRMLNPNTQYIVDISMVRLFLECLAEGCLFILLGLGWFLFIKNHILVALFWIGFGLHILAEKTGVHAYFCAHSCKGAHDADGTLRQCKNE